MTKYIILLAILFNFSFSLDKKDYIITSPNNSKYFTHYIEYKSDTVKSNDRNNNKGLLGIIAIGVITFSITGLSYILNRNGI